MNPSEILSSGPPEKSEAKHSESSRASHPSEIRTGSAFEQSEAEIRQLKRDLVASQLAFRNLQSQLRQQENALRRQRECFSRELHDETAQHLTALSFGLKALEKFCPPTTPAREALEKTKDHYGDMAEAIHHLSLRLRPQSMEEEGLYTALLKHLETWSKQHDIPVTFESTGLLRVVVPPEVELTLYRVMQEALTNVVRHAQATAIHVELRGDATSILLHVEDDGRGFDVTKVMNSRARLGLLGMQERATLLNGTLDIIAALGQGTKITLTLPYPPLPFISTPLPSANEAEF